MMFNIMNFAITLVILSLKLEVKAETKENLQRNVPFIPSVVLSNQHIKQDNQLSSSNYFRKFIREGRRSGQFSRDDLFDATLFLQPTHYPTVSTPTYFPTASDPTEYPTIIPPTMFPSAIPSIEPSTVPTCIPTTSIPTTRSPTEGEPTLYPTVVYPTLHPTGYKPTHIPTSVLSELPTQAPTVMNTTSPTIVPSSTHPSTIITDSPTLDPTPIPFIFPTHNSTELSVQPSCISSTFPTFVPSSQPSQESHFVNEFPTFIPSNMNDIPTSFPTDSHPTCYPSDSAPTQSDDFTSNHNATSIEDIFSNQFRYNTEILVAVCVVVGLLIGSFVIMCMRRRNTHSYTSHNDFSDVSKMLAKNSDDKKQVHNNAHNRSMLVVDKMSGESLLEDESLEDFYSSYNTDDSDSNGDRREMIPNRKAGNDGYDYELNPFHWNRGGGNNEEEIPVIYHHPQAQKKIKKNKKSKKSNRESEQYSDDAGYELPPVAKVHRKPRV